MKTKILAGLLYFSITLIVLFSWFHYGLMYGGGDVGLPTYNPQRILQVASQPWWTDTAPGFPRPQNIGALTAYIFFTFLQQIGLPDFMLQAVIYGILLFLMGYGMYLMTENFLKNNKWIPILAGLFYMVNPYMMVLVWHRFVYTTFFLAASLPLLFLLWRKWILEKNIVSLLLFIITNFVFSYMFTTLAFVITFWFLLSVYTFYEIFVPWVGKHKALEILLTFAVGLILWIATNVWWILPVFLVLPTLVFAQHSVNDTLSTLFEIGKQSIIPYALPGLNSFYLYFKEELGEVFKNPLFLFIPWIGVSFIVAGIFYTLKKRELIFWSILFILVIFLSKGVAPPLGYLYSYLFEKFFILGLLRNPFEKIGILIPLVSSVLFSIGFVNLFTFFRRKGYLWGKALMILGFCLFFGIYHWPFWSGTLFGTLDERKFVEIPQYYKLANNWIKDQKKDGNILHLPLVTSEASVYRWQYGYSGEESNYAFFTSNPSISMGFSLSYLDDALSGFDLMSNFDKIKYQENFLKLFRDFNVRFVVLHDDINWQNSVVQLPARMRIFLDSLPFLHKRKNIGQLTLYEMDDNSFRSKIYFSSDINNATFGKGYNSLFWFLTKSPYPFISQDIDSKFIKNLPNEDEKLIFPQALIKMYDQNLVQGVLPTVNYLPNSPLYPLIQFKEYLQQKEFQLPGENQALGFAGKRLTEASKILEKNPNYPISPIMKAYIGHLNEAVARISDIELNVKEPSGLLRQIFARQKIVLEQIMDRTTGQNRAEAGKALSALKQKMILINLHTIYDLVSKKDLDSGQQVYRFSLTKEGNYELLMADSNVASLYKDNLDQINLQIDNEIQTRKSQIKDNTLSFGFIHLKSGLHEISFPMQNSKNLITDNPERKIISEKYNQTISDIKVDPFYPNSTYILTFDYWTEQGNELLVRAVQDSDPQDFSANGSLHNNKTLQLDEPVKQDKYNKYWKKYRTVITPRKNTNNFSFQIISTPYDDCVHFLSRELCKKPEIRSNFQRTSIINVRNINISRALDNPLFLRSSSSNQLSQIINVDYTKKTPLEYEGNIILDKPGYLIFSETFNNNWKLTLFENNKQTDVPAHFFANMYGNGWFIDKTGAYKFEIRFSASKYITLGMYISVGGLIIFIGILLVNKYYKFRDEK